MPRVTWPVGSGQKWPHIWNSRGYIAYSLCNFYGATMMIKGNLQMKILYRSVFVEDFPSPKIGQKLTVFWEIRQGKLWVSEFRPPRKSNYTETRHPVQKIRRYSQKCVLQSLARKAIKKKERKKERKTRNILDCDQSNVLSKPPDRHKDLGDISHTTWVIANFDPNFVAMATRVGCGRIWLTSLNSLTPKTPC